MKIDYTIGDDIVRIRPHSQGVVKEGQIFKCKALQLCPCGCGDVVVDIGIISPNPFSRCANTGSVFEREGEWFFLANGFRSIDKISIAEVEEVLNKQPFEL